MNNKLKEIKTILSKSENGWEDIKQLNKETFLQLVNTDYSIAYEAYKLYKDNNTENMLFRGDKDYLDGDYPYLINPTLRQSQNTKNYYTTLFSEILPSWKNWPKRNHCVVCTTSMNKSKSYGATFFVFPKNNSMIAVGSYDDFWDCFDKGCQKMGILDLDVFNHCITQTSKVLDYFPSDDSKNDIIHFFKLLQKKLNDSGDQFIDEIEREGLLDFLRFFNYYRSRNYISLLSELFDPEYNGNEIMDLETFYTEESHFNKECWFDNSCLFVSSKFLNELDQDV